MSIIGDVSTQLHRRRCVDAFTEINNNKPWGYIRPDKLPAIIQEWHDLKNAGRQKDEELKEVSVIKATSSPLD